MQHDPQDNPEEKYKTLINLGIAFSILLFIGIFITIGVTKAKIAHRERYEDDDYVPTVADTSYEVDAYGDPGTYYAKDPYTTESQSDSLRAALKKQCIDCDAEEILMDHLQTETDACAKLIRELVVELGDTMGKVQGSRKVSIDFFSRTERDEELFSALFAYREMTEEYAASTRLYDPVSYRQYFPLREPNKAYGFIQTWDESQFEQEPADVMIFLKNLELDLRYYENHILWDLTY